MRFPQPSSRLTWLWGWSQLWLVLATLQRGLQSVATTTHLQARRDGIPETMFTCGYRNGDPAQGWPAPAGYECRVDTAHGIWGFCPTTVIPATDCGLGGYCFDRNTCTTGCGSLSNNPAITTWTWYRTTTPSLGDTVLTTCSTPSDPESRYCSMALLTFGVDQTYEYFHCGPEASTAHLLAFPTVALTLTKITITSTTSTPTLSRPLSSIPTATGASPSSPSLSSTVLPSASLTEQLRSTYRTTTTTSTPSILAASETNKLSYKPNTGAIIGVTIGGLTLVCVFGSVLTYLLIRWRLAVAKQPQRQPQHELSCPTDGILRLTKTYRGGWGPSELSSHEYHVRSPVELPSDDCLASNRA